MINMERFRKCSGTSSTDTNKTTQPVEWNVFNFYLLVITRINFMVDYIPATRFQRDFLSRISQTASYDDSVGVAATAPPLFVDTFNDINDPYQFTNRNECLFCRRDPSPNNLIGFSQNDYDHQRIIRRRSSYTVEQWPISPANTNGSGKGGTAEDQASSWFRRISLTSFETSACRRGSILLDGLEYSYAHLALFTCLVSLSTFLITKMALYSTIWADEEILVGQLDEGGDIKPPLATPLGAPTNLTSSTMTHWWFERVCENVCEDMFAMFCNSKNVNLIAFTLLFPSFTTRLVKFVSLERKILVNLSQSNERMPTINAVQLNLSYIHSLRTTSRHWWRLFVDSWSHRHELGSLSGDLRVVLKNVHALDLKSLSGLDMRTRLYFYNMIQFDQCYVNYFASMAYLNDQRQHDPSASNGESGVTGSSAERSAEGNNIFLAKPVHRMDLYEMAWLLVMLMVLYLATFLSIFIPLLLAITLEMGIHNFEELTWANLVVGLNSLARNNLAWLRLMQIFLWDTLIILAIMDLFNFYSCCLICYSRAAYLHKRLVQLSNYCRLMEQMFDGGQPKQVDLDSALVSLESDLIEHYSSLLMATRHHITLSRRQTSDQLRELSGRGAQIRDINIQTEYMIDWTLLLQQELADVKRFFSNYLNLEIILKVMCLVYVFNGLISHRGQIFENSFLVIHGNSAFTPIMIVVVMASFIEKEFKGICAEINRILVRGRKFLSLKNRQNMILQVEYLSIKTNRSFILCGHFAVSLGSLMPVVGWIATGVILLNRGQE